MIMLISGVSLSMPHDNEGDISTCMQVYNLFLKCVPNSMTNEKTPSTVDLLQQGKTFFEQFPKKPCIQDDPHNEI